MLVIRVKLKGRNGTWYQTLLSIIDNKTYTHVLLNSSSSAILQHQSVEKFMFKGISMFWGPRMNIFSSVDNTVFFLFLTWKAFFSKHNFGAQKPYLVPLL